MRKLSISLIAAIAVIFIIALHCEYTLIGEAASYQRAHDNRVEKAIAKSTVWATDEQILRLAEIIEKKYGSQSRRYQESITLPQKISRLLLLSSL
jgi:hypothetical protein